MKQPSNTVPPLVGEPNERSSFRSLFRPQHRRDAYYEATDRRGELYLLWMECPRFGVRMAYPCVLHEGENEPMVFNTGTAEADARNAELIRRWDALDLNSRIEELEIRTLEKAAFRKKYQEYLRR